MIRAGTLHTIQQRLAADQVLGDSSSCGVGKRGRGAAAAGPKHVPLLLRAKEPAVEERLLKLAAARGGATAGATALAAGTQLQPRQQQQQPADLGPEAGAGASMQE